MVPLYPRMVNRRDLPIAGPIVQGARISGDGRFCGTCDL